MHVGSKTIRNLMLPSQSALALFFIALVPFSSEHCCLVKAGVPMKRANFSLTENQMERLHARSEQEGVSVAETHSQGCGCIPGLG